MKRELTISDPVFVKNDSGHHLLNRFLLRFINDERDLVFIRLMTLMFIFVVPFAVYFFAAESILWWVAALYLLINWTCLMGPYILMLHCTSHRRLFRHKYDWMNVIIPWVLGPFFGESPETYFSHHIGMHHPENNLEDDLSSTMDYQRDSFKDFMKYFLRFFFLVIPDLRAYFIKKKRTKLLRRSLTGEASWFVCAIGLSLINWQATLVVLIIPLCFTRFMMMAGNWAQHAFVDAADPGNMYRNSITCINTRYNKMCFNDGYHIVHHLKPNMHYTDMPMEFQANMMTYAKEKAVVFEGIDFFMVWLLLMTKNYKYLARKFVRLDDAYPTDEHLIAFLKTRTARIN